MQNRRPDREFHVSRQARDRYQFDDMLYSVTGNVIFRSVHAARLFAQKMNERRDLLQFPEQAVRAGQINAMGLVDEILHIVVALYREQRNPQAMAAALDWVDDRLGSDAVDAALRRFVAEFPPLAVYRREVPADAYLAGETNGVPNRQVALEEMLMLWLANLNPAFSPFLELFDDTALEKETAYPRMMAGLHEFFETQPGFGPDDQNLIDMLRAPALASPHSLSGQLEFIRTRWYGMLGRYLVHLLSSLDLIREEEKPVFLGPGPALVYEFAGMAVEPERFSPDKEWMPQLVLIAKNAYVWLDQLSKKYRRLIMHLDQVPDEELDTLRRWGFSGLWLIGLWERSPASQRIKQLTGNPEAVASAYSLFDYVIAEDLGGGAAFQDLRARAWQRGIRLASDMVPNHVGIFSKWVIEHPDWFVDLPYSPFPAYSFNGPDLSQDPRVGITIEDHYYNHTDAAVVFKRVDRSAAAGSERYIYHGNDGTSMPWNDTAQLNYLKPEVREAVIQTILHVARQFPIIRFDAAMTLTKKHYQRLWFPEPGTGGAIPTRAEHGLTKAQFDAAMPEEFWREVVDRVAAEAPDTLLLAEAFWLLEGYFVRTLGMHRVYNSAFMNMLRDEDNAKYRSVIKNTIEFEPEILKRYVNFMNNPDERTAIDQFGNGDKYMGVCIMMATMPGLPMFGHGQVEGLTERYGMEYRRAYWDEYPDPALVARHEREVFPLLHRRYLFSGVEHFLLYDFFGPDGSVNEDVFAYSNGAGRERALIVYHNRFAQARGWIRTSAAFAAKTGDDGARALVQKSLGEGLGLRPDPAGFCIFRDDISGLEYIRSSEELFEKGLYVELEAYKYQVFVDFREVQDNEWHQYAHLASYLGGRGVPSVQDVLWEIFLEPVHVPFKELVNAPMFRRIMAARGEEPGELLDEVEQKVLALLRPIKELAGRDGRPTGDEALIARQIRSELEVILTWPVVGGRMLLPATPDYTAVARHLQKRLGRDPQAWGTLLGWLFTHALGRMAGDEAFELQSRSWMDEWLLGRILAGTLRDMGLDEEGAAWAVATAKLLITHQRCIEPTSRDGSRAYQALRTWLSDTEVQQFLQVNRYRDVLWFNHEAFEQLLGWMLSVAVIRIAADPLRAPEEVAAEVLHCYQMMAGLRAAEEASGYQVEKLLQLAKG
jgi:hypothetical protein